MKRILLSILFVLCVSCLKADIRLPRLVSDGMVLQREKSIKIWGWAAPNERVTISFNQQQLSARTSAEGKWMVEMKAMKAGGPHQMVIQGTNRIVLKNIVLGDVWVCSGQSNMELTMHRVKDKYEAEIKKSSNPLIRQFFVSTKYNFKESQNDLNQGAWEEANPASVLRFSAAAYFFAKDLFEKYHIPIGLINASVGGTPAESWMSEDALNEFPHILKSVVKFKDDHYLQSVMRQNTESAKQWYDTLALSDKGKGPKPWYAENYDASSWGLMRMPAFWEDEGLKNADGVVWFRKEVDLAAEMAGKVAELSLGSMADVDSTYVNGVLVGTTNQKYSARIYTVPQGLLRAGKNSIVVRLINTSNSGGFVKDKPYHLRINDRRIDLQGEWRYLVGALLKPMPPQTVIRYLPLGLYNGMIAPLLNYNIKGFIWYQGEANASRAAEYQKLFPALIKNWRKKWNDDTLPFLFVQLPNYLKVKEQPSESKWAELREAQLRTLNVPYTGMAVTIDIGEWNDIHPANKADVGKRLALAAQKVAYLDERVISSGPVYESMQIRGNKIVVKFNNAGSGLALKDNLPLKIAIAGKDKHFVWASYEMDKDQIRVWNDSVPNPVAVRYAWADNPQGANMMNKEGLLASPFRTDDWLAESYR